MLQFRAAVEFSARTGIPIWRYDYDAGTQYGSL